MKLSIFFLIIFSLTACEGRFSPQKFSPQGKRLSALSLDDSLKPDPSLASERVVLPKPVENVNWPQDGGSKDNFMQHLFMSDNPKLIWKSRIGKRSNKKNKLITNPIIYENTVFSINSKGYLIATSLDNGKHKWNLNLVPKGISDSTAGGGLAAESGIIYIVTGFGYVYAINSIDGNLIWKKNISVPLRGSPTVGNGKVFFVSILNQTYALDKKDGNILWVHSGVPETTSFLGGVSPALRSKILLSPYSSGEVYALNSDTGKVLWAEKLIKARSRLSLVKLND
ncbi:MAG: Outer membrane protein assembly factor BamB, partial [Alphaproteobacteria bacterium MarineAlpha2_Bin1]